MSFEKA